MKNVIRKCRLLLIISLVCLPVVSMACGQNAEIREAALNYLKTEATTKIELSKKYIDLNKSCPARKENYRERLKEAEKLANVDFSGYWVSGGYWMSARDWMSRDDTLRQYRYIDPVVGEPTGPTGLTGSDVMAAASALKMIPELERTLRQLEDCENQLQILSQNIQVIEPFISVWEANYKDWQAWKSTEGVYIISGYGLGLHIKAPCIGQWYYYKTENKFRPADSSAEALFTELAKGHPETLEIPYNITRDRDIDADLTTLIGRVAYNVLTQKNRWVVCSFLDLGCEVRLVSFSYMGNPVFRVDSR